MEYYTITTNAGDESVAHAIQTGTKTTFKQIAVGDGNGTYYEPAKTQTALRREVWRGEATVSLDDNNPKRVIVTASIPATVGGFTIREAGIFDTENTMMVVSKLPLSEKVAPESGASSDLVIRLYVEVSDASAVTITVDPSVVIATKMDVLKVSNDLSKHMEDVGNPHHVTAAQVGAINPNLLINPDFRINQRGSNEYNANSGYTFDRWMTWCSNSNMGIKISRFPVNNILGGFAACIDINTIAKPATFDYFQILEDDPVAGYSPIAGLTVTFSADIQTNADWGSLEIGYTVNSITYEKIVPINSSAQRLSITVDIPAGASRVYCGVGNRREFTASDVGTFLNIWRCKLELGTVPTLFSPRPYAEELAMCQRYALKLTAPDGYAQFGTGHLADPSYKYIYIFVPIPTSMRVSPSIYATNLSNLKIRCENGVTYDVDNVFVTHPNNVNGIALTCHVTTTPAASQYYELGALNDSACAVLFDSETY